MVEMQQLYLFVSSGGNMNLNTDSSTHIDEILFDPWEKVSTGITRLKVPDGWIYKIFNNGREELFHVRDMKMLIDALKEMNGSLTLSASSASWHPFNEFVENFVGFEFSGSGKYHKELESDD